MDFLGPIDQMNYLVVSDVHSKWIKVVVMKSTTVENILKTFFSRHGLPKMIVRQ